MPKFAKTPTMIAAAPSHLYCRFERGDLSSGTHKVVISGGDPVPGFAVQLISAC
jgi:hypothetical protein